MSPPNGGYQMECAACLRDTKIIAKGLCDPCYRRKQRFGTTDYQRKGKHTKCQIKDCTDRAIAKGLCDKHRQRLRALGHTGLKDDAWGAKKKHPLYNSWRHLIRFKSHTKVHAIWLTDFLQFIADVGVRPSPRHSLYAADEALPIGPGNFIWKRSVIEKVAGEDAKTYAARYQRTNRRIKSESYQGYELKRNFGISADQYAAMMLAQDGKCAICKSDERSLIRGRLISLAVDHCHTTGKVRGLLCSACNPAIGAFRDRIDLLEAAIAYLKAHAAT
jgi:hypothetical protein